MYLALFSLVCVLLCAFSEFGHRRTVAGLKYQLEIERKKLADTLFCAAENEAYRKQLQERHLIEQEALWVSNSEVRILRARLDEIEAQACIYH